jgi:hypothetical protein
VKYGGIIACSNCSAVCKCLANVLNAVGGRPSLTHSGFVPRYPQRLPYSSRKFGVSTERFSPEALDTSLKIERPEPRDAKPEAGEYRTIGQFMARLLTESTTSVAAGVTTKDLSARQNVKSALKIITAPEASSYYSSLFEFDWSTANKSIDEVAPHTFLVPAEEAIQFPEAVPSKIRRLGISPGDLADV